MSRSRSDGEQQQFPPRAQVKRSHTCKNCCENPQDFADFMAVAVQEYPQVRRWIIISEPGNFYNFRPQGGNGTTAPHLHAQRLDAACGLEHEHEALGWLYYVPRKEQASKMRTAYALAAKLGRVDTMCWYLLYDDYPKRDASQC